MLNRTLTFMRFSEIISLPVLTAGNLEISAQNNNVAMQLFVIGHKGLLYILERL